MRKKILFEDAQYNHKAIQSEVKRAMWTNNRDHQGVTKMEANLRLFLTGAYLSNTNGKEPHKPEREWELDFDGAERGNPGKAYIEVHLSGLDQDAGKHWQGGQTRELRRKQCTGAQRPD